MRLATPRGIEPRAGDGTTPVDAHRGWFVRGESTAKRRSAAVHDAVVRLTSGGPEHFDRTAVHGYYESAHIDADQLQRQRAGGLSTPWDFAIAMNVSLSPSKRTDPGGHLGREKNRPRRPGSLPPVAAAPHRDRKCEPAMIAICFFRWSRSRVDSIGWRIDHIGSIRSRGIRHLWLIRRSC